MTVVLPLKRAGCYTLFVSHRMKASCPFKKPELWSRLNDSRWDILVSAAEAFVDRDDMMNLTPLLHAPTDNEAADIASGSEDLKIEQAPDGQQELSRQLKSGTQVAHALAESTEFVRRYYILLYIIN